MGILGNATARSTELDGDQQHRQRGDMSDTPVKGRGPVSWKKKKSLKCDILNLWLMIKQKIKLQHTPLPSGQALLEAKSQHGVPAILFN